MSLDRALVRPLVSPLVGPLVGFGGAAFSPADLFASGEGGYYFAESDAAARWQDDARTTPAGNGDPLGGLTDLSGNGHHAYQDTASRRPTLTASSDKWYGVYDATDDLMWITVGSGIIKNSSGATFWGICQHANVADNVRRIVQHLCRNAGTGSRKFWIGRESTAGAVGGQVFYQPSAASSSDTENVSGPSLGDVTKYVVTINCTSGDGIVYYNGSQVGSENTTLGNFENLAEAGFVGCTLGSYTSSALWDGKISHAGCIDRVLTTEERANLDAWLSERAPT